jgi:hypothetical protein
MRIRRLLKKCAATTLFAAMMVASIGPTILDAYSVGVDPHFEVPQQAACSPYAHNHSLCLFMTASPQLATTPTVLPAQAPPETALGMPDAEVSLSDGATALVRSRSPPIV